MQAAVSSRLLYDSQKQRTFLYLGRVQHEDMMNLLEFIYLGSFSVNKSRLDNVMMLATELGVSEFIIDSKNEEDVKDFIRRY